eukprot:893609-Pleurochrysis_carterae.AAC.1
MALCARNSVEGAASTADKVSDDCAGATRCCLQQARRRTWACVLQKGTGACCTKAQEARRGRGRSLFVHQVSLRDERLVALDLGHDLLLVLRLERLQLLAVPLLQLLDLFLVLHLHLVLRLEEQLVVLLVARELLRASNEETR